jgi:tape measure domain-containing protein
MAIKVELELVDGSFTTRMLHAGETVAQFNRNVARSSPELRRLAADGQSVVRSIGKAEEASRGFLATMRDVSIVVGTASIALNKLINVQDTWIGSIVKTNAEFERLVYLMRGMSDAADPVKDAANQVNYLVEAAKKSPYSMNALTQAFVKLKATGTDPMNGSLQALEDGLAAFGGNDESLQRVALGLSQMSGKGVVQMEELRQQLAESIPSAMNLMAQAMGTSVATLTSRISTGTVTAKDALEQFYRQLDLSFGGSAARMMDTFNGQLTILQSNWQQWQRQVGGLDEETGLAAKGGFFDTLTTKLRTFNEALSGVSGQNFARELGQDLTSLLNVLTAVITKAWEWRDVIVTVAGLTIFGKTMAAGGRAFIGMIDNLKASLTMYQATMANSVRAANLLAAAQDRAGVSAASLGRLAEMRAAYGLRALMGLAGSLAGPLGLLGIGILAVADHFDLFGRKAKGAIEELREFGRASNEQLGLAQKFVEGQQQKLANLYGIRDRAVRAAKNFGLTPAQDEANVKQALIEFEKEYGDEVRQIEAQLSKDRQSINKARIFNMEEDGRKYVEDQIRELDRTLAVEQVAYRKRQEQFAKDAEARRANMKTSGESAAKIEEDLNERLFKNSKEWLETQAKTVSSYIDSLNAKANKGPLTQGDTALLDTMLQKMEEIRQKQAQLRPGFIPNSGKGDTTAQDLAKAQKQLADVKGDVKSLGEQLYTANKELADFQGKFAQGAFGDQSVTEVRELNAAMTEQLTIKKALDDVVEGKKDIEKDLESARIKLIQERMELQSKAMGRELTEGEKIAMQIKEGYYKGFGKNSPALDAIKLTNQGLNLQARQATNAGDIMRRNLFGQQTVGRIQTVIDKLKEMAGIMTGISQVASNPLGFSAQGLAAGTALTGGYGGAASLSAPVSANVEQLMATAMQHLISKGFSQVAASGIVGNLVGESKLNVNARAVGDGRDGSDSIGIAQWNSDRAQRLMGFAQLQGKSWNDLTVQLDFLVHELQTSHQDAKSAINSAQSPAEAARAFMKLFERPSDESMRKSGPYRAGYAEKAFGMGNGTGPLAFKAPAAAAANSNVDTGVIPTADPALQKEMLDYEQQRLKLQDDYLKKAADLDAQQKQLQGDEKVQAGKDYIETLKGKIDAAKQSLDGLDKNYRATIKLIEKGDIGTSKDYKDPQYAEMLRIAKETDKVENDMAERKKAMTSLESGNEKIKERQLEIEKRIAEYQAKTKDPTARLDSSGLQEMRRLMDDQVRDTETVYGKGTEQYKAAIAQRTSMLQQFQRQEIWAETAAGAERSQQVRVSLMTERQQRQFAMEQELREIDQRVEAARKAGILDVELTRQAEAEKAAVRQKYAAETPMTKQMREWSDLSGNLEKATTGWMDSMVDGMAGLINGTGDLRSAINGIANDLIKISLKAMIGQMKSGTSGSAAAGAAPANGFKALFSKVGVRHSGGLAGEFGASRLVNPQVFKNARKFHSGATQIGGRRLAPGEVPIIAKRDEGIFTPEQMKALGSGSMGGGNAITINAPVTVNSSGGTPEQNADLAKQTAKEMEGTLRGVVVDEMQKQMKVGNMLNNGRRG